MAETRRTLLTGRHIRPKFAYADARVHRFCRDLARIADEVRDLPPITGVVRDPNDDVIIATAVAVHVHSALYRGIAIITPEAFMGMLRGT